MKKTFRLKQIVKHKTIVAPIDYKKLIEATEKNLLTYPETHVQYHVIKKYIEELKLIVAKES